MRRLERSEEILDQLLSVRKIVRKRRFSNTLGRQWSGEKRTLQGTKCILERGDGSLNNGMLGQRDEGYFQLRIRIPLTGDGIDERRMDASEERERSVGVNNPSETAGMQERLLANNRDSSIRSAHEMNGRVRSSLGENGKTLDELIRVVRLFEKHEEAVKSRRIVRDVRRGGVADLGFIFIQKEIT